MPIMTMLVTKRPPRTSGLPDVRSSVESNSASRVGRRHDRALGRRRARPVAETIPRHHDWPTISPGVRLRTRRCVPVWQNEQVSVQPTWLDTHKSRGPDSGI